MMKLVLIVFACLVFIGSPRYAFADGNELLSKCIAAEKVANGERVSDPVASDGIACMAYLNGVSDLNMLFRAAATEDKTPRPSLAFCSPDQGAKAGQLARIVVKYLKAHPDALHQSEIMLTILALKDAFPCRP